MGLAFTGCTVKLPPQVTATVAITATPTRVYPPLSQATGSPVSPTTLRIWLTPQFDPASSSPSADLLRARLDEFGQRRGLQVEVRIKALSGAGGMLDSLIAANAAAPLALPDLILLPRPLLEAAALKGLLYSLDELTPPLTAGDWYDYAIQLAHLQSSTYGLPFAGDALILLYRPAEISAPPRDWTSLLSLGEPMIFPAADEQALFTLAQYMATAAPIQDHEGRPTLDPDALTRVLTFYQQAEQANILPFWLTQYTTYEQAWQAYQQGNANLLIGWTSQYLGELPVDTTATAIPTADGKAFTLITGWVWAFSNFRAERRAASIELAEYLTEGEFLARWTAAAGYLPPCRSALEGWSDATLKLLAARIVPSAQVIPRNDLLAALSPVLQQATITVLKEQSDPLSAAQAAVQRLTAP